MNKTITFRTGCAGVLVAFALSTIPESVAIPILRSHGKPVKGSVQADEEVVFYNQGWVDLQRGNLEKALKAFEKSVALKPEYIEPLLGLADLALRRGLQKEALNRIEQALVIAPHRADVHVSMGRLSYAMENYEEAEAAFLKAITLDPQMAAPKLNLAAIYLNNLQRPEDAAQLYAEVTKINPNDGEATYALGVAYVLLGKTDEAETQFLHAASLAPQMPLPWQALGDLYANQGRATDARGAYSQALEIAEKVAQAPNAGPEVFYKLGELHELLGDADAARNAFDKVLELDPDHTAARQSRKSTGQ